LYYKIVIISKAK